MSETHGILVTKLRQPRSGDTISMQARPKLESMSIVWVTMFVCTAASRLTELISDLAVGCAHGEALPPLRG